MPIAASYRTILNETEAITLALDNAPDDSLVVILPESVSRAIGLIKARNPLPDTPQEPTQETEIANSPSPATDQYAEAHS